MAITLNLRGRLADITSHQADSSTTVYVKAPSYRPGPGVELTTSAPQQVDLDANGEFTIPVVEGIGWLFIEGNGWSDSIRFVAASGMTTIWEAVVNALPIVLEAKRLLIELGNKYEASRAEILDIYSGLHDFVSESQSTIQDLVASLTEAYEQSESGAALPPYLTEKSLNDAYGYYVYNESTLDYALANYSQVNLKPGVRFAITGRKNIPENTVFNANGATIDVAGVSDFSFEFKSGSHINGELRVELIGAAGTRGVLINGDNIEVDSVKVIASTPGTGTVSGHAAGIAVSGNNITIGKAFVKNFDYAVNLISYIDGAASSNVSIGHLTVENYLRGVWIRDTTGVRIGGGLLSGKSPNSAFLSGHNGLLVESRFDDATSDVHITSVTVKDSGEHGFRLGGQANISNVWFTNCLARSVGGCGFKVHGGIEASRRHYNINYISCIVEDSGTLTQNQSAFLIERVSGGTLSNCIVRKVTQDRSCFTGIRINNCQNVVISNPNISDPNAHGIDISGYSGSCERVVVNGGVVRGPGNCGINIDFHGTTFRRVTVSGRPVLEVNSGLPAVRVSSTGGGGGLVGGAFIDFISNGSSAPVADGTRSYIFDVHADTFVDTDLVNGSTWRERNNGVIRRRAANAWGVL